MVQSLHSGPGAQRPAEGLEIMLRDYPKTITLRDGRDVTVRQMLPEDEPELLAFLYLLGNTSFSLLGGASFSTRNIRRGLGESTLCGFVEVIGEEKTAPDDKGGQTGRLAPSEQDCPNALKGSLSITRVEDAAAMAQAEISGIRRLCRYRRCVVVKRGHTSAGIAYLPMVDRRDELTAWVGCGIGSQWRRGANRETDWLRHYARPPHGPRPGSHA